jgi:hypothetical protein
MSLTLSLITLVALPMAGRIIPAGWGPPVVCTENLNPDIVVMKPAKDRV